MSILFGRSKAAIGMIHVGALPGTPRSSEPLSAVIARAREEARAYVDAGLDGLMIENMHDVPYLNGEVGPEITAAMTAVGLAVRDECSQHQDQGAREDSRITREADSRRVPLAACPPVPPRLSATGGLSVSAASEQGTGSKLPVAPTSGHKALGPGHDTVEAPPPLGVQILAAANREALAVALAVGAAFVRVENFAYAHVADEGLMPVAEAGPLLRYRRQIGAEHLRILADVKKKHSSHAITGDVSLADAARTAEFFGADAVVVTGAATGQPTSPEDAATVRNAVRIPVCVGSGLTPENLPALWPHTDVFIVGSHFKRDGLWSNPVDMKRVAAFMAAVTRLRREG